MVIKSMFSRFKRLNTKKLAVTGVFLLAMAGAISLGLATKQYSSAAGYDCDDNAIMKCGAATANEFINDVNNLNASVKRQADLPTVYEHFGLSKSQYENFRNNAKSGSVDDKGIVRVGNQVVMTDAWSMGRKSFGNPDRKPYKIGNTTYYTSPTGISFADGVKSLPVMVLFANDGTVQTVIMNACGNPVSGTKERPAYGCKALNKTPVAGKKNTYDFTTTLDPLKLATVETIEYDFGDGHKASTKNPSEPIRHTYTTAGKFTAKVTVKFKLPGDKMVTVPPLECVTEITVVLPYYMCDALQAVALNDKKTQFRFTVKARYGNGADLKNVDFTLDNTTTAEGVTTKDNQGNIYKDYTFAADGKEHTVVAKVNFDLEGGVQSVTCQAKVIPEQAPVCPVPGKGHLPPDSPECVENCPVPGKQHLPKNSTECVETPPELPKTGMGSLVGLFAGTSAFGAVAHRVVAKRRARNS